MIKNQKNLLLLTATVSPNSGIQKQGYTKTININERLNQYISTFLYYLSIEEIHAIVFIDNSLYSIDTGITESIQLIAKNLGKEVEFLTFQGSVENQLKYTYGYGEFETLTCLYNKSELFKKYKHLYKSTGRYKIYNIGKLISLSVNFENVFYKYNIFNFSALNMVFFKLSSQDILHIIENYDEFFKKHKNDIIKKGGEEILYSIMKEKRKNTLKIYPFFMTIGHMKYLFYQSLCIIGFFDSEGIIFNMGAFVSNNIPLIVKNKFYKGLNFFMKWVQKK